MSSRTHSRSHRLLYTSPTPRRPGCYDIALFMNQDRRRSSASPLLRSSSSTRRVEALFGEKRLGADVMPMLMSLVMRCANPSFSSTLGLRVVMRSAVMGWGGEG